MDYLILGSTKIAQSDDIPLRIKEGRILLNYFNSNYPIPAILEQFVLYNWRTRTDTNDEVLALKYYPNEIAKRGLTNELDQLKFELKTISFNEGDKVHKFVLNALYHLNLH